MNKNIYGFFALSNKEIKRVFRIWKQTLLPPVITTTLYFLIFGSFLGSRIGEVGGVDYFSFLIPGFIMMSLITSSYVNVSSSFFSAKFNKSIEEILSSPLSNHFIILGYVAGGMLRGILVSIIVFLISLFFVSFQVEHIILSILFIFFTSFLFSLVGLFNSFFARNFDDVNLIPTFVITPMIYLAGVFYPISELKGIWRFLSELNPLYYIIDGMRYSFLDISHTNIWISLGALIFLSGLLYIICLSMLKKGVLQK